MFRASNPMKDKKNYLSIAEINQLLSLPLDHRTKLIIITLLKTGRRVSEILGNPIVVLVNKIRIGTHTNGRSIIRYVELFQHDKNSGRVLKEGGLHVEDIDFAGGAAKFTILKKKGGIKYKQLTVDKDVLELWKVWITEKNLKPNDLLFNITRQRFHQLLAKVSEQYTIHAVNGKPIAAHQLRHSFAVRAAQTIDNPQGVKWIQEELQHSNADQTMDYVSSFNRKQREDTSKKMWGNQNVI